MLKNRKIEIIEVPKEEAIDLKCNVVTIDAKTVMSFKENTDVNRKLEALGFEVLKPHMSIFAKGGGGPRCSCFPLERDEV
jgi:N-dimethylarginine dimethylaminohydrolase